MFILSNKNIFLIDIKLTLLKLSMYTFHIFQKLAVLLT